MVASLARVRHFLFDLDGTLYLGDELLDGTLHLLDRLRSTGRGYAYVTNNSSRGTRDVALKAEQLGIGVPAGHVITSGGAAVEYLRDKLGIRRVFVLGTPSLEQEVAAAGLVVDASAPEAVLLGMDMSLTYAKLTRATHLIRAGLPFVATHPDLLCPSPEGPIPDCGALAAALTSATGVEPIVIGKPHASMLETALGRLGATPGETAIVGDRLYTDIEMGFRGGLTTILVLTGEGTHELARQYHRQPDLILPSVRDLAQLID